MGVDDSTRSRSFRETSHGWEREVAAGPLSSPPPARRMADCHVPLSKSLESSRRRQGETVETVPDDVPVHPQIPALRHVDVAPDLPMEGGKPMERRRRIDVMLAVETHVPGVGFGQKGTL